MSIKILVVEDDNKKAQKISDVLATCRGVVRENIDLSQDAISAKKYLSEYKYDVLFLDIYIPKRFDQRPMIDGGVRLYEEIIGGGKCIVPDHIIGITAYEEAYVGAVGKFTERLSSIVKYTEQSDEWEHQIRSRIEDIVLAKEGGGTRDGDYDYDLGIICAMDQIEFESVRKLPADWKLLYSQGDTTNYYNGLFVKGDSRVRVIAAAADQMGMTAAAVLSMKVINKFKPRMMVIAGVAAGLEGRVNIGDVMIADPSWDYGSGKIQKTKDTTSFLPDPRQVRLNPELRAVVESIRDNHNFWRRIYDNWPGEKPSTELKMLIGPVASGSAVIADKRTLSAVSVQNRKLIGIDMETYAVMYATERSPRPRPLGISIKAVSDYATGKKDDKYQRFAAHVSAESVYGFFTEYVKSFLPKCDVELEKALK